MTSPKTSQLLTLIGLLMATSVAFGIVMNFQTSKINKVTAALSEATHDILRLNSELVNKEQLWHQVLIDQDFAHYDSKTGEWKMYSKEEFIANHSIDLAVQVKPEESLFPLPTNEEPVVAPKTKKK